MDRRVRDTVAPFLRLNAAAGWRLGPAEGRQGISRTDGPLYLSEPGANPIPLTERFGSFGGRTTPRGLAISGAGRIFLADPDRREILTALVDAARGERPKDAPATWPFEPLWPARDLPAAARCDLPASTAKPPADPYTLVAPSDVALSPDGDLVVADPGAGRLLVMAFPTAHLRHVIALDGWAPTAICFDAKGRAHVADPGLKTVHRFDRYWRRDAGFPHPSAAFGAPEHIAAAAAGRDCGCSAAPSCGCGCESGCDCGVHAAPVVAYVIDRDRIRALREDGRAAPVERLEGVALTPGPLELLPDGALLWRDPARPLHDPVRIEGLALTRDGRHEGTGPPLLAMPRQVRVPRFGLFLTDTLDSGRIGFAWDRIALTAELPANTRLLVQTLTSDSRLEPDRVAALPPESWSEPLGVGPEDLPELLVQSPPGRYLWLRVELFGDGRSSPRIEEIDIYGPRRSALAQLPAPFHQDPESARFLDRFLHYFDVVFEEVTARNRGIAQLFDPVATPEGAFLDWLGSWFDLSFLAAWPTETRRRMIAEVIPYYRQRGTVAGLRRLIQWHTGLSDPMPQVIEHFRLSAAPAPVMIGGHALEPGALAHSFTVVLPAAVLGGPEAEARTRRLIAANVPAHTRFQLRLVEPGIAIGTQSTIGVDTLLGSLDAAPLGTGRLGHDFGSAGPEPAAPLMLSSSPQQRSLPC